MLEYLRPLVPLDMSKLKYVVLHHAAAIHATPDDIHMWHRQNGWNGAGTKGGSGVNGGKGVVIVEWVEG